MMRVPVSALVLLAFELQDYFQVEGLPEWTRKDSFDLEAQAPSGVTIAFPGQGTSLPRMLQAMLADRMKLTSHFEKRSVPMFALVNARGNGALGPNLVPSRIDCTMAPPKAPADERQTPQPRAGDPECGNRATLDSFSGRGIPLDRLIRLIIAPRLGRPVIDRTGLAGTFDIRLEFRPPDPPTPAAAAEPRLSALMAGRPSLETALQEQLGLKLQPIQEQAEVLVIDRLERPSEN